MTGPHQVKAPRDDGAVVAVPPLAEAARLASSNAASLDNSSLTVLGRGSREVMSAARSSMRDAAVAYLKNVDGVATYWKVAHFVMAGHQPELFHPGVWVKNYALTRIARTIGAVSFNLVVDNDGVKSTVVHFPALHDQRPYRAMEPFDDPARGEPYEERNVHDEELFVSLPQRVRVTWPFRPLLHEFWDEARKAASRTRLLGDRLAAARRAIERRWGCHNLEVPVSAVCQTEPFAWFACDVLTNLPRFHAAYNDAARDYRRRYGLRSISHPVPDLATEGDWLEAPFWAWRAGQGTRGRLMARLTPETIELRVAEEAWPALPRQPEALVRAFLNLAPRVSKSAAGP